MEEVLSLIEDIYQAGTEPAHWSVVLTRLADALNCSEATMGGQTAVLLPQVLSPRTDPDYITSYVEHYHVRNPIQLAVMATPVGQAIIPHAMIDRGSFETSSFYNEWCVPQKIQSGYALNLAAEGGWRATLMASGPNQASGEGLKLLSILGPHLKRAYELNQILIERHSAEGGLMAVIEEIGRGAIVVGGSGTVRSANSVAEAILRGPGGLNAVDGQLSCTVPSETNLLLRLIGKCAQGGIEGTGGRMSITRPEGQRPLSVLCMPIPRSPHWPVSHRAAAIVFVTDPDLLARRQGETLQGRYGLTPAEAALAWEIVRSGGRAEAAGNRNVSVTTVRSQLSSIFDKTGVRRQTELVRLMLENLD